MSKSPCIAFLGSTGGCTLSALIRTLNDDQHDCRALVRTPSKLRDLLKSRGVTDDVVSRRLTLLQGNAKDLEAVKLVFDAPVSTVIFGIGGAPVLTPNPLRGFFTLDDPSVCATAMSTLLSALSATGQSPRLVVISTTGISKTGPRDVPLALVPLYHWMLRTPHEDKVKMERLVTESGRDFVLVRASLLVDGSSEGKTTRVGWEGDERGPAVGYTISRDAVGEWIHSTLIKPDATASLPWVARKVTLTW